MEELRKAPILRFCCDACGRRLRSPESREGMFGKCVCGSPVVIPFARYAPAEDNPLRGFRIAGCRIDRVVGAGSFATVYKGHHLTLDIPVAIKILNSEHMEPGSRHRERFLDEARVIAIVNHRNIVPVLNAGAESGFLFIMMRYIRGQSLSKIMRSGDRISLNNFLRISVDVARALHATHKLSIIHGDVKPAHILLTPRKRAILIDFGMANPLSDYRKRVHERRAMGTPLYMSPEQAKGEHSADFRVDIYALGVTMYHMLAGQPPFNGSVIEILRAHAEQPPEPLETVAPRVPGAIAAVVAKAMEKKPDDRYQSMEELRNALVRIAKALTRARRAGTKSQ